MKIMKNCPVDGAAEMAALIEYEDNQVVSMSLSNSEHTQMSLFTFANGEMVSEESYLGDTLYHLLEGETNISMDDKVITLKAGETLAVAAGTYHAVGGGQAFKMMQITINA
ncbi:cupin domain-containing protein [Vibrio sp. JC009]|uniref:cupin domain-containing protein n=1 Tax=Vibrio sp. JC009 TaxID=2912314 RepID=UPI0023B11D06|nr:cupin domain-containing protein [Vibrio sp. JC009]WED23926.1 cupin domain-containing protein [Vibrio sp. JC009]